MIRLLVFFLPCINAEIYDKDMYFNFNDRLKADCVIGVKYQYLGNRDHDSTGRPCVKWIDVYKHYSSRKKTAVAAKDSLIEEHAIHSKCRTVFLKEEHPYVKSSTGQNLATARGTEGPWCYVKKDKTSSATYPYEPSLCFPRCTGTPQPDQKPNKPSPYGLHLAAYNYNRKLFDPIDQYFKGYEWGDKSYYSWKPSDEAFSAEYYRIRSQIFYGAIAFLLFIIIWLLSCYELKRRAVASRKRRQRAIEEIFKTNHSRMQGVLERPTPN